MPKPTPFHDRTFNLCTSYEWMLWGGKICGQDDMTPPIRVNIFALRYAAGLMGRHPAIQILR